MVEELTFLLLSDDIVRLRRLYGICICIQCENLFLDFNSMRHVFILNRYLKHYVTEFHNDGSDLASEVCHIRREIGGWSIFSIYIQKQM